MLQELRDLEKYGNCLDKYLYEEYKNYLHERLLKEIIAKDVYEEISNEVQRKEPTDRRFQRLLDGFKNTKHYYTAEKDSGAIKRGDRIKTYRTNLQLDDKSFCTKKEFIDEFMKFEFTDNNEAKKYLKQFTDLFDDEGWLII